MGLNRLLKSIAWKLIPNAEIDFKLDSGLVLPLSNKGEWACLEETFVNRGYERFFEDFNDVRHWLDLGCNVGFFSLALENHLRTNQPDMRSTALLVDANEVCVKAAAKNIARNQLNAWKSRHAVIGPEGEFVDFHQFKYSVHSGIFSEQKGESIKRYPTVPLRQLLGESIGSRDLIKIDIEGAEKNLLQQEPDEVLSFRYGICEWHAPGMPGTELRRFCRQHGLEILKMKSQLLGWDAARGDSYESPIGMLSWRNPFSETQRG